MVWYNMATVCSLIRRIKNIEIILRWLIKILLLSEEAGLHICANLSLVKNSTTYIAITKHCLGSWVVTIIMIYVYTIQIKIVLINFIIIIMQNKFLIFFKKNIDIFIYILYIIYVILL